MFDDRILGTDSAHVFYVSAQALAPRSKVVAEVGCGRGAAVETDQPGGPWADLRGDGRRVIGIDVEDTGTENPAIDEFRLIGADGRWPLDDGSVDLAVSDFVLEHVTDPGAFVRELTPASCAPAACSSGARSVAARCSGGVGTHRAQPPPRQGDRAAPARPRRARRLPHRVQDEHPPGPRPAVFDADFEWALAHRTGLEQYFKPWPRLRRVVAGVERHLPTSACGWGSSSSPAARPDGPPRRFCLSPYRRPASRAPPTRCASR